jgi:hypothetical protein
MTQSRLQHDPPALSVLKGQRRRYAKEVRHPMEETIMNTDSPFFPAFVDGQEEGPLKAFINADLYGVKSDTSCPHCGETNVVVTLGASPDPYELPCAEFKFFTFFGITELPASVLKGLQGINPNYGPTLNGLMERCYLNACAACGYAFDDEELRVDPGAAFLPLEAADYERIRLIDLGEPIDYELRLDEDEDRTFQGIEAGCCNPAPDLWQTIVEQQEF